MAEFSASIEWRRGTPDFAYETYERGHTWSFGAGLAVPAGAAPANVPATAPQAAGVDPEQAFVAALSSCHMLWFLHLACRAGLVVDRYLDEARGTLARDAQGRMAMTRVVLRPAVAFCGVPPDEERFARLHREAHEHCFIANSVRTELTLEPRIA
ncbi:MAG: OsmC family protein [Burkholderiales bacterium]